MTGILIGLCSAFAFYSFLYVIREAFRLLSVTDEYDIWTLSEDELNFYNLFFAFISLILSQSICFLFWFESPRKLLERQHYRRMTIANDQRGLNWYFLAWFSKLALAFGLLFGMTFDGGFYTFSFYTDFKFLFILIVIVLFLQTWNTIRLKFKSKSLKWMGLSFLIISILSFGLSKVRLIDNQSINEVYLDKNIYKNYHLELPESDSYSTRTHLSLINKIYITRSKTDNTPVIITDNKGIQQTDLKRVIDEWRGDRRRELHVKMRYQLIVDKAINLSFIKQIENEFIRAGIFRVDFAVSPINPEYDSRYYKNIVIPSPILKYDFLCKGMPSSIPLPPYPIRNFTNTITIFKDSLDQYYIDSSLVETANMKQVLRTIIIEKTPYSIDYQFNESSLYSDYIDIYSKYIHIIDEIRNEYAEENYFNPFDELDQNVKREIVELYPKYSLNLMTQD